MKKIIVMIQTGILGLTLFGCGNKAEVIHHFEDLDTSKFHGCLSGDGYFLVMYEGVIDEAVMGATLKTEAGESVLLSQETIVKNPDGNSLLFFEEVSVQTGDTVKLILDKEGYDTLVFEVTVE